MNSKPVLDVNFGNPDKHDMEEVLKRLSQNAKIYYGSIPKRPDETLQDYFTKYLLASRTDDRSLLLLHFNCKMEERQAVIEAWREACR